MKVKIIRPREIGMFFDHAGKTYNAQRQDDGAVWLTDKEVAYVRISRHNVGEGRPIEIALDQEIDWQNRGPYSIRPIPYNATPWGGNGSFVGWLWADEARRSAEAIDRKIMKEIEDGKV